MKLIVSKLIYFLNDANTLLNNRRCKLFDDRGWSNLLGTSTTLFFIFLIFN